MDRWRRDEGAAALEYVALLLVTSAVVAAVAIASLDTRAGSALAAALCRILGGTNCAVAVAPAAAHNRLELLCLSSRTTNELGLTVVFRGIQVEQGASDTIEQLAPDRFRVTLSGQTSGGLGYFRGDPPGNWSARSRRWGRGLYGIGSGTVGGQMVVAYDFPTQQEAEAFLDEQRGGRWDRPLAALGGVEGTAGGQLWRWVRGWFSGAEDEREPTLITVGLNGKLQAEAGLNRGLDTSVSGRGSIATGDTVTYNTANGITAWTSGWDWGAGAGLSLGPVSAGGDAAGVSRYRVLFDEHGQPFRFTQIREFGWGAEASLNGGVSGPLPDGRGGGGGGGSAGYRGGRVTVREYHLDLNDPANRAAFDRAIRTVGGLYAELRGDEEAGRALAARLAADGVETTLEYTDTGPSRGSAVAGALDTPRRRGLGGGLYGAFLADNQVDRRLMSGEILDRRWPNPSPQPFQACATDGTPGIPSGGRP